jgi:hypothetical protein
MEYYDLGDLSRVSRIIWKLIRRIIPRVIDRPKKNPAEAGFDFQRMIVSG